MPNNRIKLARARRRLDWMRKARSLCAETLGFTAARRWDMSMQSRRLAVGLGITALGIWGLAGGDIALEMTLLEKPFAIALPALALVLAGVVIPARPRFVGLAAIESAVLTAVLQGLSWWRVDEGAIQDLPDAVRAWIVAAVLCTVLICIGMLLQLLVSVILNRIHVAMDKSSAGT